MVPTRSVCDAAERALSTIPGLAEVPILHGVWSCPVWRWSWRRCVTVSPDNRRGAYVLAGFGGGGGGPQGTTTLERGGSDYTANLIGFGGGPERWSSG